MRDPSRVRPRAPIGRSCHAGAWPVLLAALALMIAVSAAPATAATPVGAGLPCSQDLLLVFANGSGQKTSEASREKHAFFGAVRSYLPLGLDVKEYHLGIDRPASAGAPRYPAVDLPPRLEGFGYPFSVGSGKAELKALLDRRVNCPDETWILGGYSQGAQVVGETLFQLSAAQKAKIGYVALFGDPRFASIEQAVPFACAPGIWTRGDAECGDQGVLAAFALSRYLPRDLEDRVGSWCINGDPVCDAPNFDRSQHGLYVGAEGRPNLINDAALEAMVAARSRTKRPFTVQTQNVGLGRGAVGVDVMVVFDTTGSMDPHIEDARRDALRIADYFTGQPNGRIGLVQFRDHGDAFVARLEVPLTTDGNAFSEGLNRLSAFGGGDTAEAQYSGIMTALNETDWRFGATKLLVVITDAPGKDPEPVSGFTRAQVSKRALEIDPVGISGLDVCDCGDASASEFLAPLAADTGGSVLAASGDLQASFGTLNAQATLRPVVRVAPVYYATTGQPITLTAAGSFDPDSAIVRYRWDLDGDGAFEVATDTPNATTTYPVAGDLLVGVAAVSNDGGIGTAISRVVVRDDGVASFRPGKAAPARARQVGPRSIRVSWSRPKGAVAALAYRIYTPRGLLVARASASRRFTVVRRLKPGQRYAFYVRAIGERGEGPQTKTNRVRLAPLRKR